MEIKLTENLIVGAGPGGLAVAGRLRQANIPFHIVEQTDKIAWSWHNHYDRLCLHTVKQLSHLPGLPFPDDYPLYVPREDLAKYYENYAKHFDIKPFFNESVKDISKGEDSWVVIVNDNKKYLAKNVIIATGVNRIPFSPTWEGQESFAGTITHSKTYKNPSPFIGKKVLIIGMGNTGAELALDLSEHDVDVTISVRSPLNIVPRDINGRPTQLTAKTLAKFPFGIGDWLGTQIRKRIVGDLRPYGIQPSKYHPAQQLRITGKTPVIDLGTVDHIKDGRIKISPDIKGFHENGVTYINDKTEDFDAVILATGYRAQVENFIPTIKSFLDKYHIPKAAVGTDEHDGLYFVGFDNYKLGGLLGTINSDSETVANHIKHRNS